MAPAEQDDPKSLVWRRAYFIFDEALDLPPEDREPFALRETAGDPDLLPIVLELLRNSSEEGDGESLVEEQPHRIGARVGRYEITGKLGRGAMGHVYAARDTELGRVVALKYLAPGIGSSGSSPTAERLIHEAKAASALNHPNIVTVYDVVRHDREIAIAMELVEGRSLRQFCGRAQPAASVIDWGRQIAQALSATHARQIVHRDIKPENVIVRPDGYVKVLDFGLARRARLPDASSVSTLAGFLGGTLNYMSPEQTRGEPPTTASDIFSLGSMLYELVCGRHPFQSASPIDTAYAIGHHSPKPPDRVRPDLPAGLSPLLLDMMGKPPALRPNAREVELRLAELELAAPRRGGLARAVRSPVLRIGTALLAIAGASWWLVRHPILHPKPLVLEPITRLLEKNVTAASLSPDGSRLAYALTGGPVYLRRMSDGGTAALRAPSALRASRVAWFADGKQILISGSSGNMEQASVWRLAVNSADAEPVLVTNQGRDAAPSPDGSRIALKSADSATIRVIDRDGGNPRVLRAAAADTSFNSLVWSPDSRRISYMTLTRQAQPPSQYGHVFETIDAESGAVLVRVDGIPLFSGSALPDGRIIGLPWAYPATSHGKELIEIRTDPATGAFRGQSRTPMPYSGDGVFSSLSVSNDGASMALVSRSEYVNVYAADTAPGKDPPALTNVRRLTFDLAQDFPQSWTADGRAIVFESNRNGIFGLFRLDPVGMEDTLLYSGRENAVQPKATPDGKWILFRTGQPRFGAEVLRIPAGGAAAAELVPTGGIKGAEQGCGLRAGSRCILRTEEGDQFVVHELDPVKGMGRILARTPYTSHLIFDWGISPDGTMLASPNHDTRSAAIRLTPLDASLGQEEKVIALEGIKNLGAVSWTAEGRGLFVTADSGYGGLVLYTDLAGHKKQLLETSKVTFLLVSPDGRHVAFPENVMSSNVQMLKRQ